MKVYFLETPGDLNIKYRSFRYPAGEVQVRILEDQFEEIAAADKIVVTVSITNGEIMETWLLMDAIYSLNSKAETTLILPYLPYARADRRFVKGDCAGLELFSYLLTAISDQIVTFDVHSKAAEEDLVSLVNVKAEDTIISTLGMLLPDKPTILLPDKGSLTRYDMSKFHGYNTGHCDKIRDPQSGLLSGFVVPAITTQSAIIVDDLCDGGGTFIGIAKEIKKLQPNVRLYLYVSHGIFSKGFEELMMYFVHVYTTDSFRSKYTDPDFVFKFHIGGMLKSSVLSLAELSQQASK